MKAVLFGPASLDRKGKYAKPKTLGMQWGVTPDDFTAGAVATAAVMVSSSSITMLDLTECASQGVFIVSPDKEFSPKGLRSNIDYQKFFNAYKGMMIEGMRNNTLQSQRTIAAFIAIIFGSDSAAAGSNGDAGSSELELGMEDLSLSEHSDNSLDLIQSPAHEEMSEHLSQMGTSATAPFVTTLSSQRPSLARPPPARSLSSGPTIEQLPCPSQSTTQPPSSSHSSSSRPRLTPTVSLSAPPPVVDPVFPESELSEESAPDLDMADVPANPPGKNGKKSEAARRVSAGEPAAVNPVKPTRKTKALGKKATNTGKSQLIPQAADIHPRRGTCVQSSRKNDAV